MSGVVTIADGAKYVRIHECGQNTSSGLRAFEQDGHKLYAVMLDKHGPNIVFNQAADPQAVIRFITDNFDLTRQTSEL